MTLNRDNNPIAAIHSLDKENNKLIFHEWVILKPKQ
jgi:hypothetical protein